MHFSHIHIDHTALLSIRGVFLSKFDESMLAASGESRDIVGEHKRLVSPHFVRSRSIAIEGIIDRKIADKNAVFALSSLFALSDSGSDFHKKITATDDWGGTWTLTAKVTESIGFIREEGWEADYWRWRVVLESVESPFWRAKTPTALTFETFGRYGGSNLGLKLGAPFNKNTSPFVLSSSGNFSSPAIVTLRAKASIPSLIKIKNLEAGTHFLLNTSLEAGDILTIDGESKRVTKNGADITHERAPGSFFPTIRGKNTLLFSAGGKILKNESVSAQVLFFDRFL